MAVCIKVLFGQNQRTALVNVNPFEMAVTGIIDDEFEGVVDIKPNAVTILVLNLRSLDLQINTESFR